MLNARMENLEGKKLKFAQVGQSPATSPWSVTLNFPVFNESETEFEDTEGERLLGIKAVFPCFQIVCLLKKVPN